MREALRPTVAQTGIELLNQRGGAGREVLVKHLDGVLFVAMAGFWSEGRLYPETSPHFYRTLILYMGKKQCQAQENRPDLGRGGTNQMLLCILLDIIKDLGHRIPIIRDGKSALLHGSKLGLALIASCDPKLGGKTINISSFVTSA